ncbi:hypothetical protein ACFXD5_15480 [Streptomyces sp. NPDC059385]|uniref:hypothetical protein n=1 Tax=Streptomyces sp. NPDC059385 TaxID=3346817 RepID=UPI0036CF1493
MTRGTVETDPDDAEAIGAYDEALRTFAIDLTRLHIQFGAPSYSQLVKASVRPKLTKAGVNEALSGKRLPSCEALLEFVRVVCNPIPQQPGTQTAAHSSAQATLIAQWRERWVGVKFLQRQAQAPWKRVRNSAHELMDQALREAEEVRTAAHLEADRICAAAHAEAEAIRMRALSDVTQAVVDKALLDDALDTIHLDAKLLSTWKEEAEHRKRWVFFTGKRKWELEAPFWMAVPNPTVLMPEDGGPTPVAKLAPNTWYLAVEWRGSKLLVQTQDGTQGLLHDTLGIQRG